MVLCSSEKKTQRVSAVGKKPAALTPTGYELNWWAKSAIDGWSCDNGVTKQSCSQTAALCHSVTEVCCISWGQTANPKEKE